MRRHASWRETWIEGGYSGSKVMEVWKTRDGVCYNEAGGSRVALVMLRFPARMSSGGHWRSQCGRADAVCVAV